MGNQHTSSIFAKSFYWNAVSSNFLFMSECRDRKGNRGLYFVKKEGMGEQHRRNDVKMGKDIVTMKVLNSYRIY